jgi:hypothetical protein
MYFAEVQILNQEKASCRITVAGSKPEVLLGFTNESLEFYFDTKVRKNWLANHVIVNFPHEEEVRKETSIQWRVNSIHEHALIDGLKG